MLSRGGTTDSVPSDAATLSVVAEPLNAGGRPSVKTPENREKILAEIRQGTPKSCAAPYCGVSYRSFKEWQVEDPSLVEDVRAAEAVYYQALQQRADALSVVDGSVLKVLLARRMPRVYGQPAKPKEAGTTINNTVNNFVTINEAERTEFQMRERAALAQLGVGNGRN